MTTIIGNGTVLTGGEQPAVITDAGVAWQGDRIQAVDRMAALRASYPEAEIVDARGGLILPGFVNLHHHFYSALARGLDPGFQPRGFGELLEGLWWRLDRSLDQDAVRVSARLTLAACIRAGCTTVFDHHASPACIAGSLDAIADEVAGAGLSAVLCYEASDRNGHDEAIAGVDENADFCGRHLTHPTIRGVMGLHASFTVSDETLAATARLRPHGVGVHLHVAEDPLDVRVSTALYGSGPVQRLEAAGLLDGQALLAHGIHLAADALDRVAAAGAVLIHNPESNANNGVGRLDVVAAHRAGCRLALGTDGMGSSMLAALRFSFLALRAAYRDPRIGFEVHPTLLEATSRAAGRFFGEPLLGGLGPGAPADIAVIEAPPPAPISPENTFGHLVYGTAGAAVRHTVARGRVLMRDFELLTIDLEDTARAAREIAPRVWERFHSLPAPTR
jgi:putative selenium metabolism protein SsnA